MSNNQSGTFVNNPDITVIIGTQSAAGIIDVSADIIDFTVERQINAVSSFSCNLNNPGRKYNYGNSHGISTMDRITVYLRRTNQPMQVFTGYVTYAPIETLIPQPVNILASCTLRVLQVTYWDDTLIGFQNMLLNMFDQAAASSAQTVGDGGVAQAVVNMLYGVVGWKKESIHIQGIPVNFINFAAKAYTNLITNGKLDQNAVAELSKILSINSITSGQSITTGSLNFGGSSTLNDSSAPMNGMGTSITASRAYAFNTTPIAGGQTDYPGPNALNPVNINDINKDIFYCSAPFSYLKYQVTNNLTASKKTQYNSIINQSKDWIAHNPGAGTNDGRLLILANQRTNRVVAVRATSIPQKPNTPVSRSQAVYDDKVDYLQCHPGVVAYLNGQVDDPTKWSLTKDPGYAKIAFSWADSTKVQKAGVQANLSTNSAASLLGNTTQPPKNDSLIITDVINQLITNLRGQLGDSYTQNTNPRKGKTREEPGKPGTGTGSFDCSGLAQWGYKSIGVSIGYDTWKQAGPCTGVNAGAQPETFGEWIPNTKQPQAGDLLFWEVKADGGAPPQHVTILTEDFVNNVGKHIQASDYKIPLNESPLNWNDIKNNKILYKGRPWEMQYLGARRPITLHPNYNQTKLQAIQKYSASLDNIVVPGSSSGSNPTTTPGVASQTLNPADAQQTSTTGIKNAYWNLMQPPQFDVRASMMVGTPRAFLLDNPVMKDLTDILQSGLRSYMSAPNGDFVAWFPDYYGVYGTDPVLDISPVEIIDFNIYHDDNQLTTHVGIVGDPNGVGYSISIMDYLSTNGIVSIEDGATMQLLFGTNINSDPVINKDESNALTFLNRYGMRPFVSEQQMIKTHTLEYFYALYTFMEQWANQFVSTINLTFMPEVYPGMRISMDIADDTGTSYNYKFYVKKVTHQGSRSGGFTTQVELTAPMKNDKIMHYGLELAQ